MEMSARALIPATVAPNRVNVVQKPELVGTSGTGVFQYDEGHVYITSGCCGEQVEWDPKQEWANCSRCKHWVRHVTEGGGKTLPVYWNMRTAGDVKVFTTWVADWTGLPVETLEVTFTRV